MDGLDRDREGYRSQADVSPSKKEVCRRPAIRLISKKTGCCLPPKGFPPKRTRHKRCAMRFPQKVCKMNDVQLTPLKREALLTACNGLPPKSKCYLRLAIRFPQKVRAVDGLQLAFPKKLLPSTACNGLPPKKFLPSTASNRLPQKSFRCRRLTISFPRKVFAIDGLQLAFPEKFLLLTACNSLPLKSKGCRRLATGFPQKVSTVDGLQRPSGTGEKWVSRRRRASRKVIWPEPARRCGKWRGRPSGDGEQCGARRSS